MRDRRFTFWYYTVSHGQALLRSVRKDNDENIDIYFGNVSYIEIPTVIDGLEIRTEPSSSDKEYINGKIGSTKQKITVLVHEEKKYYIVSSSIKIMKNNLLFHELPFDIPNDMGKVFYRPDE